ncbi:hypothetical protein BZG36_03407, partial [Bifiguratus adelaidae]
HARINPFFLPWAMRGIIEDAEILGDTRLTAELTRLKELLSSWEPISSKLRETKHYKVHAFFDNPGIWKPDITQIEWYEAV